ncbi:MAG: AMP-binding protein [Salinivirgaceae bacterium]|jgi:long-chain acyl-CoA synthetase|nr:AMP-binding protein [Salinivirgaceae bacterium]
MINLQNLTKPAIIGANYRYTYQDLLTQTGLLTHVTQRTKADKVAIFAKNSADWIFAFYAGWNAGKTIVPIDFLASAEDVIHIIKDCEPGLVFYDDTTAEKWAEVQAECNKDVDSYNFSSEKPAEDLYPIKWETPTDEEQTAVIIYTSGTTGSPKGVMLSFKNLKANIYGVSRDVDIYSADQQVLMLLPLHHIFPLAGSMMIPLFVGGTIVESPSMQSSDLLATFANNQIGLMIGVPKLYTLLYQGIYDKIQKSFIARTLFNIVKTTGNRKLAKKIFKQVHDKFGGQLTFMISGGAALDPKIGKFFHALGFHILEGYGMTEAAPMITFTRPGKFKAGSPGHALPSLELRIKEEEIIAKGDNVMKGYYNRPEETNDVLKDGWLYTGDLGKVDKKGFLHITGRKKDIIVLPSGKNINPILLERKLEEKPQISEAALFLHKNFLHALIIPDMAFMAENNITDIDAFFRRGILPEFNKSVTSYKRIMRFAVIDEELPRTRLGKIQRFKLPALFESPAEAKVTDSYQPDIEEYQVIKSFIEQQIDMNISPNQHIELDIAMDSLDKLSLMDFIEGTFGVKLDEEKLLKFPSVAKMAEHVREHKLFQKIEMPDWSSILKERVNLKLPKSWISQILIVKGLKYIFMILFRFKSKGKELIPEGPAIITPNHQSYLDALLISSFLKNRELRKTFFYAKKKHMKSKFMNFMAAKHNVIVMDMNSGLKESIQKLALVLKEGKKVVIFPEGTRSKTGEIGDFKKTFAILSKELNVPVVPVAIDGAFKALPSGKKIPKLFAKVQITYMAPIYPKNYELDDLTKVVKEKIADKVEQNEPAKVKI